MFYLTRFRSLFHRGYNDRDDGTYISFQQLYSNMIYQNFKTNLPDIDFSNGCVLNTGGDTNSGMYIIIRTLELPSNGLRLGDGESGLFKLSTQGNTYQSPPMVLTSSTWCCYHRRIRRVATSYYSLDQQLPHWREWHDNLNYGSIVVLPWIGIPRESMFPMY